MKILKIVVLITAGIVVLIAGYVVFLVISFSGVLVPNPRIPEITYAEFPFKIEIEYTGERLLFEDAILCEYDGVGVGDYGSSKHRLWKERFASGKEYQSAYPMIVLLDTDDVLIEYISGEGAYYMDKPYYEIDDRGEFDKDNDGIPYTPTNPSIYVDDKNLRASGEFSFAFIDTTSEEKAELRETLGKYGVEIVSIEQTPPIENTFR